LGQSIADRWHVKKFLDRMYSFHVSDTDAYGWNIQAQRDIGVCAGSTIFWLYI
jgi:hypothetical protein